MGKVSIIDDTFNPGHNQVYMKYPNTPSYHLEQSLTTLDQPQDIR